MTAANIGGLISDGTPVNKNLKFLGRLADEINNWSESQIQMYIIQEARRSGYVITGSMEQGKRSKASGGRAKGMGMTAGMPDMLCWRCNGRIKAIELKTTEGKLSKVQIEFHKILMSLGYDVGVVYAESPADGWKQVKEMLECHG